MAKDETTAAEPARSMALLWGELKRGARGPKPTMTVDQIAQAAIEIADAEGLAALSMRRVADRLGVGTMSLYRYVPAKAELIEVMLDTVLGEAITEVDTPAGWRAQLESYARQTWALAQRHPWMIQVPSGRGLIGPNQAEVVEAALRSVEGVGLTDGQLTAAFMVVSHYVRGAALSAVEASQLEQTTGMSDEQWWRTLGPLLGQYLVPEKYPLQARVWQAADLGSADEVFEFGLQRLLDGIELLIAG